MRKLEFRTEAVLGQEGGISQFSTALDALADLVIILTTEEALRVSHLLETIVEDKADDKEFVYFTLTGAGRGVLK